MENSALHASSSGSVTASGSLTGSIQSLNDFIDVNADANIPVYAGFIDRFIALFIDLLAISSMLYIATWAAVMAGQAAQGVQLAQTPVFYLFAIIFYQLFFIFYFIYFHMGGGQTPGKKALGIKITDERGGEAGFVSCLLRAIGYFVSFSFLMAGFLWSLIDRNRQTWHDKLAGTVVVKTH